MPQPLEFTPTPSQANCELDTASKGSSVPAFTGVSTNESRKVLLAKHGITLMATLLAIWVTVTTLPLWISPIRFQQFDLLAVDTLSGNLTFSEARSAVRALPRWALDMLLHSSRYPLQPTGRTTEELFQFVFSWLPSYCVVHPTEGFYYYRATLPDGELWGNIRVADAQFGELTFAAFRPGLKSADSMKLGKEQGVEVRLDAGEVAVEYRGKSVRFKLPQTLLGGGYESVLLPNERAIAPVFDESGTHFILVFNDETDHFYYLLDPRFRAIESYSQVGNSIVVGSRSGFALYQGANKRTLLVGVGSDHISENDFFDGPGDQVPYSLDFAELLYRAYPHVMLGNGIDATGVFLGTTIWKRVAVAPYLRYKSIDEVRQRVQACDHLSDKLRSSELTRELWNNEAWQELTNQRLAAQGIVNPRLAMRSMK
jgi:hypothetical protein